MISEFPSLWSNSHSHVLIRLHITDHVISLDAPDDVLKKRAQALPERVAEKMRCTEAEYIPRLEKFRNAMDAEESVLDYFDELEIHPKHIGIAGNASLRIVQQT